MATRPGAIQNNRSDYDEIKGRVPYGDLASRYIDPLGIGDAFFGGDPMQQDYSGLDAENDEILNQLQSQIPDSYKSQDYLGDYSPTILRQGDSAMNGISTDPKIREYQIAALNDLETRSSEGLTAQDKANIGRLQRDVDTRNAGRIGAIKSNMAQRGLGGSGLELAASLSNAQAGANREADAALETAAQSQNNQRAAAQELGSLSGQMRNQEFGEKSAKAKAVDDINRFNTQNAMSAYNQAGLRNQDTRQTVANNNANAANKYSQDQFGNRANVAGIRYNDNTNKVNESKQEYQNAVNAKQAKKNGILQFGGQALGAAAAFFSDEEKKTDISHLSDEEIEEFLNAISPKRFRYKDRNDGDGNRMGIVAQDIEHTAIGRDIVKDHGQGKELDIGNVIGALLDAVGHLNRKVG